MKCLSVIAGGLAAILWIIAGFLYLGEANFLRHAELTTATVTTVKRQLSVDEGHSFCPVFEFTTRDGQSESYLSNVCTSPASYKVGDQEQLYYDPQNPQHVQMKNFWSEYTAVFVLGVVGAPFFLLAMYALISDRPRR